MRWETERAVGILFLLWLALACLVPINLLEASSFDIAVKGSRIDIQAEQVPLIEILNAISERTGVIVNAGDQLTDPVSVNIRNEPLERCLRRLLANRNYSLIFKKTADGEIVPVSLLVLGKDFVPLVHQAPPPPDDHLKRFRKEWVQQELGDTRRLAAQVSADPLREGPDERGIRITRLTPGASLEKIGLRQGDIIHDVNGQPVRTVEEFTQAIQAASGGEPPIMRIERLKNDHSMDPIYIEVH